MANRKQQRRKHERARAHGRGVDTAKGVAKMVPQTLKSDKGDPIVSIWPGDGEVRVEKEGIDVLELIQEGVGV